MFLTRLGIWFFFLVGLLVTVWGVWQWVQSHDAIGQRAVDGFAAGLILQAWGVPIMLVALIGDAVVRLLLRIERETRRHRTQDSMRLDR